MLNKTIKRLNKTIKMNNDAIKTNNEMIDKLQMNLHADNSK